MNRSKLAVLLKDYIMYIVLLVLVIIFSFATRGTFINLKNLTNIVNQNVSYLVVGVGITFIMLAGALDLSTGYQISTIAVIMGLLAKSSVSTPLIIIAGLFLGVMFGTINGAIYARLKVFPFIITLAVQYVLNGATYLLSNSKTFRDFDSGFNFLGGHKITIGSYSLPVGILVMIVVVLAGSLILNKTYFGRNIYALGSNPETVKLSGVSVPKTRILVFAVAGIFVGIGTILNVGRIGASSSGTGLGTEFTVMAGAMLGGVKMGGGGGKINNMVVGMLIIGLLNNGMNLMNLNTYWQYVAMGIILLLAITTDTLQTESVLKKAKMVIGNPDKKV